MTRLIAAALSIATAIIYSTSPAQLYAQSFEDKASAYLSEIFSEGDPGVSIEVTVRGQTLFSGAIGTANIELGVPLQPEMPFEIASITKQVTSAAIMLLHESGKLSVSDKLSDYFPGHASGDATIEQLMRNISGVFIPDHSMGSNHIRGDITPEQRLQLIDSGNPLAKPGDRYIYNNAGYWLLGDIIEQASGVKYEAFLRKNFFTPLGMDRTYYGSSRELIPRRVSGYDITPDGIKNSTFTSVSWSYSAGGLIATAKDIAKWSNALFSGKVLSSESVNLMTTPTILNDGSSVPYGLGLALTELEGHRAAEHGGGHSGFLVHTTRLLDDEILVVVLANYFYLTNGYRPPNEKNPANIARSLALMAVNNN